MQPGFNAKAQLNQAATRLAPVSNLLYRRFPIGRTRYGTDTNESTAGPQARRASTNPDGFRGTQGGYLRFGLVACKGNLAQNGRILLITLQRSKSAKKGSFKKMRSSGMLVIPLYMIPLTPRLPASSCLSAFALISFLLIPPSLLSAQVISPNTNLTAREAQTIAAVKPDSVRHFNAPRAMR